MLTKSNFAGEYNSTPIGEYCASGLACVRTDLWGSGYVSIALRWTGRVAANELCLVPSLQVPDCERM